MCIDKHTSDMVLTARVTILLDVTGCYTVQTKIMNTCNDATIDTIQGDMRCPHMFVIPDRKTSWLQCYTAEVVL